MVLIVFRDPAGKISNVNSETATPELLLNAQKSNEIIRTQNFTNDEIRINIQLSVSFLSRSYETRVGILDSFIFLAAIWRLVWKTNFRVTNQFSALYCSLL